MRSTGSEEAMNVEVEGNGVAAVADEVIGGGGVTVTVGAIGVATIGTFVSTVTEGYESPQPDRSNTNEKNRMKRVFM